VLLRLRAPDQSGDDPPTFGEQRLRALLLQGSNVEALLLGEVSAAGSDNRLLDVWRTLRWYYDCVPLPLVRGLLIFAGTLEPKTRVLQLELDPGELSASWVPVECYSSVRYVSSPVLAAVGGAVGQVRHLLV
jgi:hypothetical protein